VSSVRADYTAELQTVAAIGDLTNAPNMYTTATGSTLATASPGEITAVYVEGEDYEGSSTRFYAYIGIPSDASASNQVPGVVLVHGGGGTAKSSYVQSWVDKGFAAMMIAVEGQTDDVASDEDIAAGNYVGSWYKHAAAGPARSGNYGDTDVSPITDQWMYHAVANTVLANSLMSTLAQVDSDNVGVAGVSWGGVITSTVIGIDDRFAFAINIYGCGHLYDTENYMGNALVNNAVYKAVWDPYLRMENATMPTMWFSWPEDAHFDLAAQSKTYGASPATHMVSLIPELGHGESKITHTVAETFAQNVVHSNRVWCTQESVTVSGSSVSVEFYSAETPTFATLVSTTDSGFTGDRTWITETATLVSNGSSTYTATATLPSATTAWFMNLTSFDGVTSSSDYQDIEDSDEVESVITWSDANDILEASDVSTTGTSVWAYSFGASRTSVVNGVTFIGESNAVGNTDVITDLSETYTGYGNSIGTFSTLAAEYQSILESGAFSSAQSTTITLSGLNIGSEYEVQFWINDSRNRSDMDSKPRTATITETSVVVDYNTAGANTNDGLGQSISGTFTANQSTMNIELNTVVPQLNAIQLRIMSEPVPIGDTISGALLDGTNMTISWTAASGATYGVEAATNLMADSWVDITNGISGLDQLISITNGLAEGQQFFRIFRAE
jgi:dienelactone hydrolase